MITTTLIGALLGFAGSIVPAFMGIWKDKIDKKHELDILDMQLQQSANAASTRLEEVRTMADLSEKKAIIQSSANAASWVGTLNGTVRPVIAYGFFAIYIALKLLTYWNLPKAIYVPIFVYQALWTPEDSGIFAGIMAFYYGSRAFQRR